MSVLLSFHKILVLLLNLSFILPRYLLCFNCNSASTFLQFQAWFRRGKANASLKNYEAAIRDLEISLSMEGSLSGKKQIKEELNSMSVYLNGLMGKSLSRSNLRRNKVSDLGLSHLCILTI